MQERREHDVGRRHGRRIAHRVAAAAPQRGVESHAERRFQRPAARPGDAAAHGGQQSHGSAAAGLRVVRAEPAGDAPPVADGSGRCGRTQAGRPRARCSDRSSPSRRQSGPM